MGKHRSRYKILANILEVINDNKGAKKTQIMYQAFLSYKLLVQYLNDVMEAGLVVCEENNCYSLTPKGKSFLVKFNEYYESHESINEKMNQVEDLKLMLEEMCPNSGVTNGYSANSKQTVRRGSKEA